MKRLLPAVLVALALPATASAKEPVKATVCGADRCASTKDQQDLAALANGGIYTAAPKHPARGYKVRMLIREGDQQFWTYAVWEVPSQRVMRSEDGTWMELPAAGVAALRRITRDIRPFPPSAIPAASPEPGGGALPPQTYNVAPRTRPVSATTDGGGLPWALIAAILVALAALGVGANRLRAPLRTKLRKEKDTWESSTTGWRSSPDRPAASGGPPPSC